MKYACPEPYCTDFLDLNWLCFAKTCAADTQVLVPIFLSEASQMAFHTL
jgi:hypothetical protein